MTDLLTNTFLILSLFIAVTTLARAMNPKAPSINFEDSAKYRFDPLSHGISSAGLKRLNAGSNADLGLLRALAVKSKIHSLFGKEKPS